MLAFLSKIWTDAVWASAPAARIELFTTAFESAERQRKPSAAVQQCGPTSFMQSMQSCCVPTHPLVRMLYVQQNISKAFRSLIINFIQLQSCEFTLS